MNMYWTTKPLMILLGCEGLSAPLLFAYGMNRFSHEVAHMRREEFNKVNLLNQFEPSRDKINKMSVRPAKTQISLGISPVWSESSLCAQWVAKDPSFLHVDSEDSDQTGLMPRLIWVFAGCILILLVLSRESSFIVMILNIPTGRSGQTVNTQNRLLIREQQAGLGKQ